MDRRAAVFVILAIAALALAIAYWRARRGVDWREVLARPDLTPDDLLEAFVAALRERIAPRSIARDDRDPLLLHVETRAGERHDVSLDNVWARARGASQADRVFLFEDHLATFEGAPRLSREAEISTILPTVRDDRMVDFFREKGLAVPSRPLAADLHVVYVFDQPRRIQVLDAAARERLGLSAADLERVARENLARRFGARIERHGEKAFMLTVGGNFESSLLLLDDLWKTLAPGVPGELIACVPARDVVVYAGTGTPDGVETLRRLAAKVLAEGDHQISGTMLRWTGSGWQAYAPPKR